MVTVCDGWARDEAKRHPRVHIKTDGIDDGLVSHSMCKDCQAAMDAEMDAAEAAKAGVVAPRPPTEYELYVQNFPLLDPRD